MQILMSRYTVALEVNEKTIWGQTNIKSFFASSRSFMFEVVGEVVSILFAGWLSDLKAERHESHFKTPLFI